MKNSKKELKKSPIKYVSKITFDKRLNDLRGKIIPSPKYEESNKMVASLDLDL